MQDLPATALRKRRRKLVRDLPPLEHLLRGSLTETYKRCGRPRRDYVPNAVHEHVAHLIGNLHKLREALNEICAINAELLRRREGLG